VRHPINPARGVAALFSPWVAALFSPGLCRWRSAKTACACGDGLPDCTCWCLVRNRQ